MNLSVRKASLCLVFAAACSLQPLARAASQQSTSSPGTADTPPYKNAGLPIPDRVADLLSRMTLEEKVEELTGGWENKIEVVDPTGTFTTETARKTLEAEWGAEIKFTPRNAAILRNAVQRFRLEKTRLGIPDLFPGEALHGYMEYGSTSFPQALGLASTFDPALVKRVFTAVGDEAGSRGAGQVFSPVLDIARDPRWGRTEECFAEDPYLAAVLTEALVRGMQGRSGCAGLEWNPAPQCGRTWGSSGQHGGRLENLHHNTGGHGGPPLRCRHV